MSRWLVKYFRLTLVQLAWLWLVLAISPNISPVRGVWVLIIVYIMMNAASTSLHLAFDQEIKRVQSIKHHIVVWVVGAVVLYGAAAFFSIFKVGALFSALIVIYAAASVGLQALLQRHRYFRFFKSILNAFLFFIMLYVGINQFPAENIFKLSVILPGVVISAFDYYLFSHPENDTRNYNAWLAMAIVSLAIAITIWYCQVYLTSEIWPAVSIALVAMALARFIPHLFRGKIQDINLLQQSMFIVLGVSLNLLFIYIFAMQTHILQLIH